MSLGTSGLEADAGRLIAGMAVTGRANLLWAARKVTSAWKASSSSSMFSSSLMSLVSRSMVLPTDFERTASDVDLGLSVGSLSWTKKNINNFLIQCPSCVFLEVEYLNLIPMRQLGAEKAEI